MLVFRISQHTGSAIHFDDSLVSILGDADIPTLLERRMWPVIGHTATYNRHHSPGDIRAHGVAVVAAVELFFI